MEKKRYEVICPVCGVKFYACKSLGHLMGWYEMGSGNCLKCSTNLNLTFVPDKDKMRATIRTVWLKKQKGKRKHVRRVANRNKLHKKRRERG